MDSLAEETISLLVNVKRRRSAKRLFVFLPNGVIVERGVDMQVMQHPGERHQIASSSFYHLSMIVLVIKR